MTGGLLQLAVYGSQDLYLTGVPQVTFFKIIYRRHTNFSLESIRQEFIGVPDFGYEMTAVLDKAGDLMGHAYLEIDIPEINLTKNMSSLQQKQHNIQEKLKIITEYYHLVKTYFELNIQLAKEIYQLISIDNIPIDEIRKIIFDHTVTSELLNAKNELNNFIESSFVSLVNLQSSFEFFPKEILQTYIFNTVNVVQQLNQILNRSAQNVRDQIKKLIQNDIYPRMQKFYAFLKKTVDRINHISEQIVSAVYVENYKCAWVEELGYAVIDQLDYKIGNQVIDRHTGDWLIMFNQLMQNVYQDENYRKMIGNVPELTTFDRATKPAYKLIIPFVFSFCKYTGLMVPLISLRYHDVSFDLRLKDLSKVFFVEDTNELPDVLGIKDQYNITINSVCMYIDYVYLDNDERQRFAQSTHEYLIDTVQYNEFTNIESKNTNIYLTFAHPTKYLLWFCQPNQYRSNPNGRNKCQWNNYGTNDDKTGYTLKNAYIRLNTYNITESDYDIKYFNYVQPYQYFVKTPQDGLYAYSFSLNNKVHQPSGTCNLSRIDNTVINMSFTQKFIDLVNSNNVPGVQTGVYVAAYTLSYNIVRFVSGMAGLAFVVST